MEDPLLTSLCGICHTNQPKYRCPRCEAKTCSLACTKRHKLWASCNGIRDPTAYIPKSQLLTASGIDHDYNFISAIERGIDRSDRRIVEEKGLVDRKELFGRKDQDHRDQRGQKRKWGRDEPQKDILQKALYSAGVIVDKAPKGMQRNLDNGTNYSKSQHCINWTVEWVTEDGTSILGRTLDKYPLRKIWYDHIQEETGKEFSPNERKRIRKRRTEEVLEMLGKKKKVESRQRDFLESKPLMQNLSSGAWGIDLDVKAREAETEKDMATVKEYEINKLVSGTWFYLLLPRTPALYGRVLIPLSATDSLRTSLRDKVVLEFPTIYVLPTAPEDLDEDKYILEESYQSGAKAIATRSKHNEAENDGSEVDDSDQGSNEEDDNSSSGTSSEGSGSDLEDGEIV